MCHFDCRTVAGSGKVGPVNGLPHQFGVCSHSNLPSYDGSLSLCFGGDFVLSRCFLEFSVGIEAFVMGLSRISSIFSCIETVSRQELFLDGTKSSLMI